MFRTINHSIILFFIFSQWILSGILNAQPVLVKDINTIPYCYDFNPMFFSDMNGVLYFSANTNTTGFELWRSDGTSQGTYMVKDMCAGDYGIGAWGNTVLNNVIYFNAWDFPSGNELWRSDGTENGTYLLKDIYPGPDTNEGSPYPFTTYNNLLFFFAINELGEGLWISDGTENGTVSIFDSMPRPDYIIGTPIGVFFDGDTYDYGKELWYSNGTEIGTYMVKDLASGTANGFQKMMGYINNAFIFSAKNELSGNWAIYKTNGTHSGTYHLQDLEKWVLSTVVFDSLVIFSTRNQNNMGELWRTNGTELGTYKIFEFNFKYAYPKSFQVAGNNLFFDAADTLYGGELWLTDGTTSGTRMIADIEQGAQSSMPQLLTAFGNKVVFSAEDSIYGRESYISDGTEEGTFRLADLKTGTESSDPNYFCLAGNKIFFAATDDYGKNLYASDGTSAGTYRLNEIINGTKSSSPYFFHTEKLFENNLFSAYSSNGNELWKTDGTTNGTVLVKDIWPGPNGSGLSFPYGIIFNNKCLFAASDSTNGKELWCSDGTETGTYLLKDIKLGTGSGIDNYIPYFLKYRDKVIFLANGGYEKNLWQTDGTENGTVEFSTSPLSGIPIVIDSNLYLFSGNSLKFYNEEISNYVTLKDSIISYSIYKMNNEYYFAGDNNIEWNRNIYKITNNQQVIKITNSPYGLGGSIIAIDTINNLIYHTFSAISNNLSIWKSDGTQYISELVKEIDSDCNYLIFAKGFGFINNSLVFTIYTKEFGTEIWRTDGTESGTFIVKDIWPGQLSGYYSQSFYYNNRFYFIANDGISGNEIWVTDGTNIGTHLLFESADPGSGAPTIIDIKDNTLLFTAIDNVIGRELWKYDLSYLDENLPDEESVIVWPVPANNILNFEYYFPSFPLHIELYDILGKKIISREFKSDIISHKYSGQIDISGIASGCYIVLFISGDRIFTAKIVK